MGLSCSDEAKCLSAELVESVCLASGCKGGEP